MINAKVYVVITGNPLVESSRWIAQTETPRKDALRTYALLITTASRSSKPTHWFVEYVMYALPSDQSVIGDPPRSCISKKASDPSVCV